MGEEITRRISDLSLLVVVVLGIELKSRMIRIINFSLTILRQYLMLSTPLSILFTD